MTPAFNVGNHMTSLNEGNNVDNHRTSYLCR